MARTKQTKATVKNILGAFGEGLSEPVTLTIGVAENAIDIAVKRALSINERRDMVSDIANMVFSEDADGNVVYCPYLKKFAFEFNLLAHTTNIVFPEKIDDIWTLLTTTNIVDEVIRSLPDGLFREIADEANELIEFRKAKLVHETKIDALFTGIVDIVKTINQKISDADGQTIVNYLKENIPELKNEIERILQEQNAEDTAK